MCGILGASGQERKALTTASHTLAHRGPDANGYFFSEAFSLSHHRLAIIDLNERSTQPFASEDGSIHVVFNGEIYNFRELRAELEPLKTFRTESDTEVILRGYQEWGTSVFERLKGMFAIAILDSAQNVVHLARDHAGIKPLYYSIEDGKLVFASEVKAIAAYYRELGSPRTLSQQNINLFLAFGYIPAHGSLLEGVQSLPPSTRAVFSLAEGTLERIPYVTQSIIVAEADLPDLIERRVLAHLIADVPVGLFFSGGIDSSLIAAILAKHGINLQTWSIGLPGKQGDREAYTGIARELGINAHVAEFGPRELDENFEAVMQCIDEPLADNSLLPTYFVSALAAKEVKIVLSGEGGDEYFLGYPRMHTLAQMQGTSGTAGLLDATFAYSPDFHGKNKLFMDLFSATKNAPSYYLLATSPARNLLSPDVWKSARAIVAKSASEPINYDASLYLEYDLLRKTDMATMYSSIEGRVPLLDPDIVASARAISTAERLQGGETKAVLKRILATYISPEFVYRPKSGFGMDLSYYWEESKVLKPALFQAEQYLSEKGIELPLEPDWSHYIRRYPNLCFGLITLARSLQNLGV